MIFLYSGTPGSGKSLHMAEVMRCRMHYGKAPVVGNFSFNARLARPRGYGSFYEISNVNLSPDFLIDFSEQYRKERRWRRIPEEHILLVIDECHLLFNSREWQKQDRGAWISFFSQHRKLGYQVILVAQNDRMIDRQIRALIEYECIHRKVGNAGKAGKILNLVSGGGLHVCVKVWYPLHEKVGSEFFRAKKSLFRLFDSYTRFTDPG